MRTKQFAFLLQPTGPQWDHGSYIHAIAHENDAVFMRPAMLAKWARYLKILNPDLQIIATIDDWLRYDVVRTAGKDVIVPDCPEGYYAKNPDGSPMIHSSAHRILVPNYEHGNPDEISDYIIERYVNDVLGYADEFVDGFCHDWCQDGFWDETTQTWSGDHPAVEFREEFLRYWKASTGRPVYHNPGSASTRFIDACDGIVMEGHELGGTLDQIRECMIAWADRGKDFWFVSRPVNEYAGVTEEERGPGGLGNLRLLRADYCRALVFGAHFSIEKGYGHEGYARIDEMAVDLGHEISSRAYGPIGLSHHGVWYRDFDHGRVCYYESDEDIEILQDDFSYDGEDSENITLHASIQSIFPDEHGVLKPSPTRRIGDGAILTSKPMKADKVAGLQWIDCSPGVKPIEAEEVTWSTEIEPENPFAGSTAWCCHPVYNVNVTNYGPPYQAHTRGVGEFPSMAHNWNTRFNDDSDYIQREWRHGQWTDPHHLFESIMARYIKDVPRATTWKIHGSDVVFVSPLISPTKEPTPIISLRDQCFGVECDGIEDPFDIYVGGRKAPIKLVGGFWSPRHTSMRFTAVFDRFDIEGSRPIRYVDLYAVRDGRRLYDRAITVGVVA